VIPMRNPLDAYVNVPVLNMSGLFRSNII
jgi:hypothetical protein